MPTITLDKQLLLDALHRPNMTTKEFDELGFEFGMELEEETSEAEQAEKEGKGTKGLSERPLFRIDICANRIDLLCLEGVSRALNSFLNNTLPQYKTTPPTMELHVDASTKEVRPFVVAAILRKVTFDPVRYKSFIDLQEKLHQNICRKRTLVAIGTHDLDTIKGPFQYKADPPSEISFIPLNQTETMTGDELMEFYEHDPHLGKYLHIIREKPRYPVIYDAQHRVLSLPPIINGDHSKITLETKNVFIECTATDERKAAHVLNTVVTMFSEYCDAKFTVEQVKIVYPHRIVVTPQLEPFDMTVEKKYIEQFVGVPLSVSQIQSLLIRMGLRSTPKADALVCHIPPTRSDILHPCDIAEDVAIAYGYNNIPKTKPQTHCVAQAYPINKLSDAVRLELAMAGFTEVLNLSLNSHKENFEHLNLKDDSMAVHLANPKTVDYEVVRTLLLPGILKVMRENKKTPLPLKFFEVSDVVLKDLSRERSARNERHVIVAYSSKQSGFEIVHGVLDMLMSRLEKSYSLRPSSTPFLFPKRRAEIIVDNVPIGTLGILDPSVMEKFELRYPLTVLEFTLQPFL